MRKNKKLAYLLGAIMIFNCPMMTMAKSEELFKDERLVSPLIEKTEVMAPFGQGRIGYEHQGIDVAAAMGTPLYAVADGMITKAAPDSKGVNAGGGHMIFIDHRDGTESRYMHLSDYAVKTGDFVKAGELIGFSGNSGDTTTAHLHYEYRIYGQPVNPYFIFEDAGSLEPIEDTFLVEQN